MTRLLPILVLLLACTSISAQATVYRIPSNGLYYLHQGRADRVFTDSISMPKVGNYGAVVLFQQTATSNYFWLNVELGKLQPITQDDFNDFAVTTYSTLLAKQSLQLPAGTTYFIIEYNDLSLHLDFHTFDPPSSHFNLSIYAFSESLLLSIDNYGETTTEESPKYYD
jgi:hypothetical protein